MLVALELPQRDSCFPCNNRVKSKRKVNLTGWFNHLCLKWTLVIIYKCFVKKNHAKIHRVHKLTAKPQNLHVQNGSEQRDIDLDSKITDYTKMKRSIETEKEKPRLFKIKTKRKCIKIVIIIHLHCMKIGSLHHTSPRKNWLWCKVTHLWKVADFLD